MGRTNYKLTKVNADSRWNQVGKKEGAKTRLVRMEEYTNTKKSGKDV